jgi:hypothetical protein
MVRARVVCGSGNSHFHFDLISIEVDEMRGIWGVAGVALLAVWGCGSGGDGPGYAGVSGVVTMDGNPVEGATVVFTPTGAGTMSMGLTNASGEFTLTTSTGKKGAAIGDHAVTVSLVIMPEAATTGSVDDLATQMPSEAQDPAAAEAAAAKAAKASQPVYLVPQKYGDAKTSGLTATITSGGLSGHKIELVTDCVSAASGSPRQAFGRCCRLWGNGSYAPQRSACKPLLRSLP